MMKKRMQIFPALIKMSLIIFFTPLPPALYAEGTLGAAEEEEVYDEMMSKGHHGRKKYNLVSGLPDIYISARTEQIGLTWVNGNVYDKPLIELVYSILKNREDFFVFLDVGAQTGSFTLLAKYFPNSEWHAFEPIKEAIDELNVNLLLNDIRNVSTYQVCVSDQPGWRSLRLPTDTHWGLATLGERPLRFGHYEERRVECIALDSFVAANNIKRVDFIKIDTEGWELFVLNGGQEIISKNKPVMLMEFNRENMKQCNVDEDEIYQFLNQIGYELHLAGVEDILCIPKA